MNNSSNNHVFGSDSSSRPEKCSKPTVPVLRNIYSLGKSSPDSTTKTMQDASSSWSENSSSSNNSGGGLSCGVSSYTNYPTFLNRSLDLESVFEEDADDDNEENEQDEFSVITDFSKTARTDDNGEKDELIARLSLQVAELQQKVVNADQTQRERKQQPPSHLEPTPWFSGTKALATRDDNDEEQFQPQQQLIAFPKLATVSRQDDLRSKYAKRGKSVRRFYSDGSIDTPSPSVSMSRESLTKTSGNVLIHPAKNPPPLLQSSFRVQQAEMELQKSFTSGRPSRRGFGTNTSGPSSMSSLDSPLNHRGTCTLDMPRRSC